MKLVANITCSIPCIVLDFALLFHMMDNIYNKTSSALNTSYIYIVYTDISASDHTEINFNLTIVDYAQLFSGAISHVAHVTETGEIVALVESHILDPQQENIDPQVQYRLVLVS